MRMRHFENTRTTERVPVSRKVPSRVKKDLHRQEKSKISWLREASGEKERTTDVFVYIRNTSIQNTETI
jgi:hypothetical protein